MKWLLVVVLLLASPDRFVPPPFGFGFGFGSFLLFGAGSLVEPGLGGDEGSGCGGEC